MLHKSKCLLVALLAASVAACGSDKDDDTELPPPLDLYEAPVSIKAKVKFKGAERLRNDFAKSLGLERNEVCNELGAFSCTDLVHTIALGGVEPYFLGVNVRPEETTATTPIAVDRVALSACGTRVDRDLAGDTVIFADLPIDTDSGLADIEDPAVSAAIDTLYKRAIQRAPKPEEIASLKDMYAGIDADSDRPARDWAVLSCFAVMTSMENLFY